MTISPRCAICKYPQRRRLVTLGWNDGMSGPEIATALDDSVSAATILKHVNEHTDGEGRTRTIDVRPTGTVRERVIALQELQLNEVERRIELAKQRAAELNANLDEMAERGTEGAAEAPRHDWSEFTDILGKDMQAAIGSILKAQGLSDKREKASADLKLGLFEAMARAGGLAPKAIVGEAPKELLDGESDD